MVQANDFFTENEKRNLAEMASTFANTVHDQESFDDFLFTLRASLTNDEATRLLAMGVAVVAASSRQAVREAAALYMALRTGEN